jgi:hypothetical protein
MLLWFTQKNSLAFELKSRQPISCPCHQLKLVEFVELNDQPTSVGLSCVASAISLLFVVAHPLQTFVRSSGRVVLLLPRKVTLNPRKVVLAETDDSVASLPLKNFVVGLAVDVVGSSALECLYKIADRDRWFDADCQVDVSGCPADPMQPCSLCAGNSFSQASIHSLFQSWIQQWHAELRMPVEVQEYLVVDVARHG